MQIRKISITDKLIITAILISSCTIFIVASYSFFYAKKAILARSFNQLTSVRVIKTKLIKNLFESRVSEAKYSKYSTDIQELALYINKYRDTTIFSEILRQQIQNSNLYIKKLKEDKYENIFIIGKNKRFFFIKKQTNTKLLSQKTIQNIWDNTTKNEQVVLEDYNLFESENEKFITISTKLKNKTDETMGIIVFEISQQSIDAIMLENSSANGLGKSGESYLVGEDNLMRSSSRFIPNSVMKTTVKTQSVAAAFTNKKGTKIITDYRNILVLSSYDKISFRNINWAIVAEMDYKEATTHIYQIRNEIIFISIFIFLIVLIAVFILSKRITFPIQQLNKAAKLVGKGDFNILLKSNLNDEIGELILAFNEMVAQLKSQSAEIETQKINSLRSLVDGQEAERLRLSRELHDSLGQQLIGLKLKYESYYNNDKLKKNEQENYNNLSELFAKTIDEVRQISNNLMPATLLEFGLIRAIKKVGQEMSDSSKIDIQIVISGTDNNLEKKIKVYIYRIIQEALTNIIKHSGATSATIKIDFLLTKVCLNIKDNGIGFNKSEINFANSHGISNINDRVTLLGAKINISSSENKGTHITIVMPR